MRKIAQSKDLRWSLRFKQFLGADRVERLRPGEHPLGEGFAAVRKQLAGLARLTEQEDIAVSDLQLVGETVLRHAPADKHERRLLADDLMNARRCPAVLFEIEVIRFGVAPVVARVEWCTTRQGERDLRAYSPDLLVECKLIRVGGIEKVLRKIRDARAQPRPDRSTLVVAVGFEDHLAPEAIENIAVQMRANEAWFRRHPDVSAVLIFSRAPANLNRVITHPLGLSGREFHLGAITQVVNWNADYPLPSGFSFGG